MAAFSHGEVLGLPAPNNPASGEPLGDPISLLRSGPLAPAGVVHVCNAVGWVDETEDDEEDLMVPTKDGRRIVVGVDGSPPSRAALELGVQEARCRDARLVAVHAWNPPTYLGPPEYTGYLVPGSELRAQAAEFLDQAVANVPDDIRLQRRVVEGPIVTTLIEMSADAELVLVGSRGRGGFAGLLLGSTSHQLATHAHCPVVVVPAGAAELRQRVA